MASAAVAPKVTMFTAHTDKEDIEGMNELERNVVQSLATAGITALAPTKAHELKTDDHMSGMAYVFRSDTPASPLVFGPGMMGNLAVFRVEAREKGVSADAIKASLTKATRAIGMAARAEQEPYTVTNCYDKSQMTGRDKAKWSMWLGPNDFVGAYVRSEGLSNEYYLVVKADGGAAAEELSTHIKRRIANDGATYRDLHVDPVLAAVQDASQRNVGRIASAIAAQANMNIKEMDDRRAKVLGDAYEAPPRVAIANIMQPYNVLVDLPTSAGVFGKFKGYMDKVSPLTATTSHVVVPVSPIDGVVVCEPSASISGLGRTIGVPLGAGLAPVDKAAANRDQLQGKARHDGQMSANLNEMFSWRGRTAGKHDNAELWRYNSSAASISTLGSLLGTDVTTCTLKPLHVCLPFTASA